MALVECESDQVVDDAVEILVGDWRRKGRLEAHDIARITEKRRLDVEQLHAVLTALKRKGIVASEASYAPEAAAKDQPDHPSIRTGELLTREEERTLANAIRLGARLETTGDASPDAQKYIQHGRRARNEFITRNLKLVHWVARDFRSSGLDYDDLVQEGSRGLIRAVEMFDPDLGYKFSTYATWWIRQAIIRGIDEASRLIRVPVHRLESIRRLRRMKRRLEAELGREPSVARLAAALDWSVEKTAFITDLARFKTIELDAPLADGSGSRVMDSLPDTREPTPEERAIHESLRSLLDEMIAELPGERMKDVIRKRMGFGTTERTLEEIGQDYGVTRERIRQIEAKALRILSHPARVKLLKVYME